MAALFAILFLLVGGIFAYCGIGDFHNARFIFQQTAALVELLIAAVSLGIGALLAVKAERASSKKLDPVLDWRELHQPPVPTNLQADYDKTLADAMQPIPKKQPDRTAKWYGNVAQPSDAGITGSDTGATILGGNKASLAIVGMPIPISPVECWEIDDISAR